MPEDETPPVDTPPEPVTDLGDALVVNELREEVADLQVAVAELADGMLALTEDEDEEAREEALDALEAVFVE